MRHIEAYSSVKCPPLHLIDIVVVVLCSAVMESWPLEREIGHASWRVVV